MAKQPEPAPGSAVTAQDTIRSSRLGRAASLASAGARVGINYLKHYGRSAVTSDSSTGRLHTENAEVVFKTFSKLKGGPLKLAQMLSIDKNLLPSAYAREFARAQYSAPPLSYPLVARTFRREFGKGPEEIFETFSKTAVHGASIGQVHKATLKGRTFAVKVQYPGVARSLRSDLQLIKPFALAMLGLKESEVRGYLKEVEIRLLEETDYRRELLRGVSSAKACSHLEGVGFPEYFQKLSSDRVLTMSWVEGALLDQFADSGADQTTRDRIGQALWDFYDCQIHGLRQFHADPHPGNFLVRNGKLFVLDFGCTKDIDSDFHRKHFRFLEPGLADRTEDLESALEDLGVILPADSPEVRLEILDVCAASVRLLARPFAEGSFDFADPSFMEEVFQMGMSSRDSSAFRKMRGQRGSPDSIYVNRAYFGLYSLLSRIRARVQTRLPVWAACESVAAA